MVFVAEPDDVEWSVIVDVVSEGFAGDLADFAPGGSDDFAALDGFLEGPARADSLWVSFSVASLSVGGSALVVLTSFGVVLGGAL